MAHDLVKAQIAQRHIDADGLNYWLARTHSTLLGLVLTEELPCVALPAANPGHWRRSIREDSITCMVCGKGFRQLGNRHLAQHGLDVRTYRERYRIPVSQPLSAKASTRRRSEIMKTGCTWELRRGRRTTEG
jgi:predicted transcriptional regulator